MSFLHLLEGDEDRLSIARIQGNPVVGKSGKHPYPGSLVLNWLAQDNLGFLAGEPRKVAHGSQRAFYAGGTDFERVRAAGDYLFYIEDGPYLHGHEFTVGMRHSRRFVDENTEDAVIPRAQEQRLDDLYPFRRAGSLRYFGYFRRDGFSVRFRHPKHPTNKKVGFRPPLKFDNFSIQQA
ncbi:MAG TPA: hypothetical protein VHD76_05685 [Bryobacteraceae bacterium]|jgi:hypothetical protein|nr:hypothetical protein [Bryobacteraceae bacterium]